MAVVGSLSLEHVRAIWRGRFSSGLWDACLHELCRLRADFANEVALIARKTQGIERIALLFCLDTDRSVIREELEQLASLSDVELAQQPFDVFSIAELDWTGTGPLYLRLLARRIEHLSTSLLGPACRPPSPEALILWHGCCSNARDRRRPAS
jgi:hypothetical protein